MNILEETGNFQAHNLELQDQLAKSKHVKEEEYDKATNTIMDLKLQVKEAIRIKEEISNSLKYELKKTSAKNKRQLEEISRLRRELEDKDKELTRKLQEKYSEINTLLEKLQKESTASQRRFK